MPRNSQVIRQWSVLRRIEGARNGISARRIAQDLHVQIRSIYRDIEALQSAGFPIYSDEVDGSKHWCMLALGGMNGPALPVTHSDVMALCCARSSLVALGDTPYIGALESLFAKLESLLSPTMQEFARCSDMAFVGDSSGCSISPDGPNLIVDLQQAITSHLTVQVEYRSQSGDHSSRMIDPYNIWVHRNILYLVAWCHLRQEIRTFSVTRIQHLTLTAESFTIQQGYSFEDYASGRFRIMGDGRLHGVRIWFSSEAAIYVGERQWSTGQRLVELSDGAVELQMEVDGIQEIASWVISFGPRARALAPAELVDKVRHELCGALDHYNPVSEKKPPEAVTPDVTGVWFHDLDGGEHRRLRDRSAATGKQRPEGSRDVKRLTFTALDMETTDLEERQMVEVAAVKFCPGQVLGVYTSLVRPAADISAAAARLHGIREPQLTAAPRAPVVLLELMQLLRGTVIVAHNALFDLMVLAGELVRAGLPVPTAGAVDTVVLSRRLLPDLAGHGLERVKAALDLDGGPAHRALPDAMAAMGIVERALADATAETSLKQLAGSGWVTFDDALDQLNEAGARCPRVIWELAAEEDR